MDPTLTCPELEWTKEEELETSLNHVSFDSTTVVLDFDETLWLRNSTEEFLASVRPSILASVVLQMLGFIKPWQIISRAHPEYYRDLIRVWSVLIVAPWSPFLWRRAARRLGPLHANPDLLHMLLRAKPRRILVASYGFGFIVRPLLAAIDTRWELAVAATLRNAVRLRREGKGAFLARRVKPEELSNAVVITDNFVDQDLCRLAGHARYVSWEKADFRHAGLRPLLPFGYLTKIKRPKEGYIVNGVLGYDYAVLWLAIALGSPHWIAVTAAVAFYLVAFFSVYEIGYYENDRVGLERETAPVVSKEYHLYAHHFSPRWAWAFGLIFAAIGAAIQTLAGVGYSFAPTNDGGWVGFVECFGMAVLLLVVTRLTFAWFNASGTKRRIVPMLFLQLERTIGYAIILPIHAIGALLCVSHAIGRWVPYVIYRYGGSRKDFPAHVCTLLVFAAFFPVLFFVDPGENLLGLQAGIITVYLLLRAARDYRRFNDGQ